MKGVFALLVFGLGLLGSSALVLAADDPPATDPASQQNTTTVETLADPPPADSASQDQTNTAAASPKVSSRASADASANVSMTNSNSFSPNSVTVSQGDSVTWHNSSNTDHNVTGSGLSSGTVGPGGSYSHTFSSAGTFSYQCTFHSGMTGTVSVTSSGGSGGGGGSAGTSGGSGSESSAGESANAGGSDSQLPATGSSALPLALLGFLMLGSGLALRRRAVS